MKGVIIAFIMLLSFSAQAVIVKGNAPSYKGKYVSMLVIEDYITYAYRKMDKQVVDSTGHFTFDVKTDVALKVIFEIEDKSAIMYIDPNTEEYKIHFPKYTKHGQHLKDNNIQLVFEDLPDDDLNTLILEYNLRADNFLFGDSMYVIKCIKANYIEMYNLCLDDFKDSLIDFYKPINNPYFHNYVRYSIAQLEQLSTGLDIAVNRINVFNNYIKDKPVLYGNDAYMDFIYQFYENSLNVPVKGGKDRLYFAINNNASVDELNSVLADDHFLKDGRLREIVMIKGLGEVFYSGNYIQNNIIEMLAHIQKNTVFKENRVIAKNVLKSITRLKKGYPAPNFELVNSKGDSISLKGYKGKYVYVSFWASWNNNSVAELGIISDLQKKYGKYIEFVSISVDRNVSEYKKFMAKNNKYKWDIAHYAGESGLLAEYSVKSLPEYYLINPDGNIEQSPAYRPSPNGNYESIDVTFFAIKDKLEPKKRIQIGGKN